MKRNIIAAGVCVSAAVLAVTGCSSGSAASTAGAPSSSVPQKSQVQQKPVSLKDDPDEGEDVSGFRLESKLVNGVTNTHLKFEVTNHTSEVCDYTIVVDLDSDAVLGRTISIADVPPGETVAHDEEVDAADGNVIPLMIDRFTQDEGWHSDDLGRITQELRRDGSGLVMDWSMTNYAGETSAYEVKYRVMSVGSKSYGEVVYESTLKTKALGPAVHDEYGTTTEPGGTETGSVKIPTKGIAMEELRIELIDQDRITEK